MRERNGLRALERSWNPGSLTLPIMFHKRDGRQILVATIIGGKRNGHELRVGVCMPPDIFSSSSSIAERMPRITVKCPSKNI